MRFDNECSNHHKQLGKHPMMTKASRSTEYHHIWFLFKEEYKKQVNLNKKQNCEYTLKTEKENKSEP